MKEYYTEEYIRTYGESLREWVVLNTCWILSLSAAVQSAVIDSDDARIRTFVDLTLANKRTNGIICNSERDANMQYTTVKAFETFTILDRR